MNDTPTLTAGTDHTERLLAQEEVVIPIVEETLSVSKRVVEQGGVRIVKTVTTEEATIEEPTIHEGASVERVAVNRLLSQGEELPKARREGDTLIIPIFEEVVVTEKRMRLTEELHILLTRTETVTPQTTTIRRESVHIESIAPTNDLQSKQD